MRKGLVLGVVALGLGSLPAAAQPAKSPDPTDPEAIVETMYGVSKPAKGLRPSHAKGLCAEGTFTATPEAAEISTAPTFGGRPLPAMVRLGVAGASLAASDKARSTRGMALRLELPDGGRHEFVMISAPVFSVRKVEDFIPLLESRRPDPATGKPDPAKVKAYNDAHPEVLRQAEYLAKAPVPASFAQAPFWGVNTFYFTGKDGQRRPARWTVEPVAGVVGLSEEQLKSLPDNFLADELRQRVAQGPVAWDFYLQFPAEGDPLADATAAWPSDRRRVKVGRLAVTKVAPAGEPGPCEAEMFDPLVLPTGIEPSDDPVLLVRSPVYAISVTRRQAP